MHKYILYLIIHLAFMSFRFSLTVHSSVYVCQSCTVRVTNVFNSQPVLLFTSCQEGEFTCHDGTCVAKRSRCNLRVDCTDQSDELFCDVVLVPKGYSPRLPPPAALPPLLISLDVTIIAVREIDLTAFQISLDLRLEMVWRDSRLRYNNLQDNMWANKLRDHTEVIGVQSKAKVSIHI